MPADVHLLVSPGCDSDQVRYLGSLPWDRISAVCIIFSSWHSQQNSSDAEPSPVHFSNFFFKLNRLHQFLSYFSIFGWYVHSNIDQKPMELEFWFSASIFFNQLLIAKNRLKLKFFEVIDYFPPKVFNVKPWNLVYRHIVSTCIFKCVWKWSLWVIF